MLCALSFGAAQLGFHPSQMNLQMLQLSAQTINGLAVYLDLTLKTSDNLFFLGVLKGQTLNLSLIHI